MLYSLIAKRFIKMAKIFLEKDETFPLSVASTVIGAPTATGGKGETITLPGNPEGVTFDANIERIEFASNLADYNFAVVGANVEISLAGKTIASITINNTIKLVMADGAADLEINGAAFLEGSVTLGGVTVPLTTAAAVVPTTFDTATISTVANVSGGTGGNTGGSTSTTAINVTAANKGETSDASTADNAYTFEAGNYDFTIAGFGAGDKLDFPDGQAATVSNTSFTDGIVDLSWALSGQVVSVQLTGLPAATDAALGFPSDFATVFGAADTLA